MGFCWLPRLQLVVNLFPPSPSCSCKLCLAPQQVGTAAAAATATAAAAAAAASADERKNKAGTTPSSPPLFFYFFFPKWNEGEFGQLLILFFVTARNNAASCTHKLKSISFVSCFTLTTEREPERAEDELTFFKLFYYFFARFLSPQNFFFARCSFKLFF